QLPLRSLTATGGRRAGPGPMRRHSRALIACEPNVSPRRADSSRALASGAESESATPRHHHGLGWRSAAPGERSSLMPSPRHKAGPAATTVAQAPRLAMLDAPSVANGLGRKAAATGPAR